MLKTSTFGRHVSASSRSQPVTLSRYQLRAALVRQLLGGMWAELSSLHVQVSWPTPFLGAEQAGGSCRRKNEMDVMCG